MLARHISAVWISAVRDSAGRIYAVDNLTNTTILGFNTAVTVQAPVTAIAMAVSINYTSTDALLATLDTCILSIPIPTGTPVTVAAGDCEEQGTRQGPPLFARFVSITSIAWNGGVSFVFDSQGGRVAAVTQWAVTTITSHIPRATALALAVTRYSWYLAVALARGGFYTLTAPMLQQPDGTSRFDPTASANVSDVLAPDISATAVALYASNATIELRALSLNAPQLRVAAFTSASPLIFSPVDIGDAVFQKPIALIVSADAARVCDGALKACVAVEAIAPCTCPAGNAHTSADVCVPLPAGGYADGSGTYVPCPPGTFGPNAGALTPDACMPCPGGTSNDRAGSSSCIPCTSDAPLQTADGTACTAVCGPGQKNNTSGACTACSPGSQASDDGTSCVLCPPGSYSSPEDGVYQCTACPTGSTSNAGSAWCTAQCTPSSDLTVQSPIVYTIAILGLTPLSLAAASNGTVYVGSFLAMLVIDSTGMSRAVALPNVPAVASAALSPDESVLYAVDLLSNLFAITSEGAVVQSVNDTSAAFSALNTSAAALAELPWEISGHAIVYKPISSEADDQNTTTPPAQSQTIAAGVQSVNDTSAAFSALNTSAAADDQNTTTPPAQSQIIAAGSVDSPGRIDGAGIDARFTSPAAILLAPDAKTLLVADYAALRGILFAPDPWPCQPCPPNYLLSDSGACIACPTATVADPGDATACSPCPIQGQYLNEQGDCAECPDAIWWSAPLSLGSCRRIRDTLVPADAIAMALPEVLAEAVTATPDLILNVTMQKLDYVSQLTLATLIPYLRPDAAYIDIAARTRFWTRLPRLTPVSTGPFVGPVVMPGMWFVCSTPVSSASPCTCRIAGNGVGFILGSLDPTEPWGSYQNVPEAPGSQVLPLFVTRTDHPFGLKLLDPSFLLQNVDVLSVTIPPAATPNYGTEAICVLGWPATTACTPGSIFTLPNPSASKYGSDCVPCLPGYYEDQQQCVACPSGTYAPFAGLTTCTECGTVVGVTGASTCPDSQSDPCPPGTGLHGEGGDGTECVRCSAGTHQDGSSPECTPCPPGTMAEYAGTFSCVGCPQGQFASAWGSRECTACPLGTLPSSDASTCWSCSAGEYLDTVAAAQNVRHCLPRNVTTCPAGTALRNGGPAADNFCTPCAPCTTQEVMVPLLQDPCPGGPYIGELYKCVPVQAIAGYYASVEFHSATDFQILYFSCQDLPPYAAWAVGPFATTCYFQCQFGVSSDGRARYATGFAVETGTSMGEYVQASQAAQGLMPLPPGGKMSLLLAQYAAGACATCPTTTCALGMWRPIVDLVRGCGPPIFMLKVQSPDDPSVQQLADDGCVNPCTLPNHTYPTAPSPPGAGDACPWSCISLYFSPPGTSTCLPCQPETCAYGELFVLDACTPNAAAVCFPCPSFPYATLLLLPPSGKCMYACDPTQSIPNPLYVHPSLQQPCIPCPTQQELQVYCPAGQSPACAPDPCPECPPLPTELAAVAVPSPTRQIGVCTVMCLGGYQPVILEPQLVTLPIGTPIPANLSIAACQPCTTCTTAYCSAGAAFDPVAQTCAPCPSWCPPGQYPAPCLAGFGAVAVCLACPNLVGSISDQAPRLYVSALYVTLYQLAQQQLPALLAAGQCPVACPHNSVPVRGVCVRCSTVSLIDTDTVGAVWNATPGTRWWPPSQDPPSWPPRPPAGVLETRAGRCWPCPPSFVTMPGDDDLCTTKVAVTLRVISVSTESSLVGNSKAVQLNASSHPGMNGARRRLLSSSVNAMTRGYPTTIIAPIIKTRHRPATCEAGHHMARQKSVCSPCPLFAASAPGTHCKCAAAACRVCRRGHIHTGKTHACSRCPDKREAIAPGIPHGQCACREGTEPTEDHGCRLCPIGSYSPVIGHSPCIRCPNGTTTYKNGATRFTQCIPEGDRDILFS